MVVKVLLFVLMGPKCLGNPLVATNKLSLATWGSYFQQDHMGPGTYAFGYDVEDPVTGNVQFKQEERHPNGTVSGSYGYVDADGKPHVVTYVADEKGYRAKVDVEGERTKYHPAASPFLGNSLRQSDDHVSPEVGSPAAVPLEAELEAYRLRHRAHVSEERNNEAVNDQWARVPLALW